MNSTNTLVYHIISDAFKYLKLGPATAEAVVLLTMVGILTFLYFFSWARRYIINKGGCDVKKTVMKKGRSGQKER